MGKEWCLTLKFIVQNVVHRRLRELGIRSVAARSVGRFFILLLRGVVRRRKMIWVGTSSNKTIFDRYIQIELMC